MINKNEKPMQFGFISTMIAGDETTIPWSKRISAYNAARRWDSPITIRKQPDGSAKVISLNKWAAWDEE